MAASFALAMQRVAQAEAATCNCNAVSQAVAVGTGVRYMQYGGDTRQPSNRQRSDTSRGRPVESPAGLRHAGL
eukprot:5620012-Lingulodinium_polyedra.AAC.1